MSLAAEFAVLPGRCPHGYDLATQHPTLCDCQRAAQGKRRGLAAVNAEQSPVTERIDAAIARLATTGRPFTANDMRADLADVPGPVVGGRFNAAARRGLIRKTGVYIPSTLGSTHAHPICEWVGASP